MQALLWLQKMYLFELVICQLRMNSLELRRLTLKDCHLWEVLILRIFNLQKFDP